MMPKAFKAWLKGNRLQWIGDAPELAEQKLQVHVTFLDDRSVLEPETRGQRMAEILEILASTKVMADVDPVLWQQGTRQDTRTNNSYNGQTAKVDRNGSTNFRITTTEAGKANP